MLHAENGRAGIELLQSTPDVDIVLMDIMMPEMDGYETMRAIRKIPAVSEASDHRADGQGDEGRPRKVPARRRFRLRHQAGGPGTSVLA